MRTILTLAIGVMLGMAGWTMADHDGPTKGPAKVISEKDIVEKIDGKESKVTTVEVTLEPGQSSPPHRHPGPVFGDAPELGWFTLLSPGTQCSVEYCSRTDLVP